MKIEVWLSCISSTRVKRTSRGRVLSSRLS